MTADDMNPDTLRGKRVLVVDDSAIVRHTVVGILQSLGFDPEEADDGKTALAALQKGVPDAVILDIHMPGKGGFETLTEMRADERFAQVPVFILTSSADMAFVRKAASLKVSGYLLKSELNPGDLGTRLGTVLGRAVTPPEKKLEASLQLRVLLAHGAREDHSDLVRLLADWSCTIMPTDSRDEAVSLARSKEVDAVLIEEDLADCDGFQLAAALRAEFGDSLPVPLILLTEKDVEAVREAGERAGLDAYLGKPVGAARLLTTLQGVSTLRSDSALFDRHELLERAGHDDEIVASMMSIWARDAPALLSQIGAAIDAADAKSVGDHAHSLKGMLGTVAAHAIADTAQQVETAGREDDLPAARQQLATLHEEVGALSEALDEAFG
jgi:CheY-like chemotaxis protein